AAVFADAIRELPGIRLVHDVQTNMVIFDVSERGMAPGQVSRALQQGGELLNGMDDRRMRAVTIYGGSREECQEAAAALAGSRQNGRGREAPQLGYLKLG